MLAHFDTEQPHEIAIVGDRVLSDIVMGNSHGFLTILVDPLDKAPENSVVKLVRKFENNLLSSMSNLRPPLHKTISY